MPPGHRIGRAERYYDKHEIPVENSFLDDVCEEEKKYSRDKFN